MGSCVDGGRLTGLVEDQDLLPILRRVLRVEVRTPGRRREPVRKPGIGEDRVAMRFDHVDGPGVPGGGRGVPQDVDHLAGRIVGHQRAESRQGVCAAGRRSRIRVRASDGDDLVAGVRGIAVGGVELRVVHPGHHRQPMCATVQQDRGDQRHPLRVDECDPVGGRHRNPRHIPDPDAGQRSAGDRVVQRRPHIATPRIAKDDG